MTKKEKTLALLKEEYAHNGVKIFHCLVTNSYPTEEFLKSLSEDELVSLITLFKLWANMKGDIRNPNKFKKLERYNVAILEFKDYQVRLAGFWKPGYNFCLVYGFKKKSNKWPKVDLKNMRNNYDAFVKEEQRRNT